MIDKKNNKCSCCGRSPQKNGSYVKIRVCRHCQVCCRMLHRLQKDGEWFYLCGHQNRKDGK